MFKIRFDYGNVVVNRSSNWHTDNKKLTQFASSLDRCCEKIEATQYFSSSTFFTLISTNFSEIKWDEQLLAA